MNFMCTLVYFITGANVIYSIMASSNTVIDLSENFKVCQEATTKFECISVGCTFDCLLKKCFPMEYMCLHGVTSPCFHHCNDKASCESVPGCEYDETGESCNEPEDSSGPLPETRSSFGQWELLDTDNCYIRCVATPLQHLLGKCNLNKKPTLEQICQDNDKYQNFKCCQRPTLPPPTSRPPTSPPTAPPTPPSTTTIKTTTTTELPQPPTPAAETTTTTPLSTTEVTLNETDPLVDPPLPGIITRSILCPTLNYDADKCRQQAECAYNCETDECVVKDTIREDCNIGCSQYCFDSCGCKAAAGGKCEYVVATGKCLPRQPECPEDWFGGDECARSGHFYAFGGALCFNSEQRGKCEVDKNVLSVNTNGRRHVDERGILYQADDEVPFDDAHNGRRKFFIPQSNLTHIDHYLFKGFVSAIGHGKEKRQCLQYSIPLENEGQYELSLNVYEPYADRLKRRMFNIEMHDQVVVPDLDIFALVGRNHAMNIVINFNVTTDNADGVTKLIALDGHTAKRYLDQVKLSICVGDCRLDKRFFWEIGNYIISGFSVVKFN